MPVLLLLILAAADSLAGLPRAPTLAARDSVSARVVRVFPPLEVRTILPDPLSIQTVHSVPPAFLRALPVEHVAEAVALKAGVVAVAEELHVRGGRAGETTVDLEGFPLNEPLRRRPIGVPMLALSRADLVSGAPDARFASGLAGVINLHTIHAGPRPEAEWRWRSDGRLGTHYDRVSARASSPLGRFGLGVAAAGDVTLDDTWLPNLRTASRRDYAGLSLGWRAENRVLGFLKLAPVSDPERFSVQWLVARDVHEPYSPNWSLDGWTLVPASPKAMRIFSPVQKPGYQRYRAADHLAITDDRSLAGLLSASTVNGPGRYSLNLGWLRTRSVTSVGGSRESGPVEHRPSYGPPTGGDGFYVVWGDYPLYRESDTDVLSARTDAEFAWTGGSLLKAGAGLAHERVSVYEYEWFSLGRLIGSEGSGVPLDSLRRFQAGAPAPFAYAQGRWRNADLVLNAGLRAEYFTAGDEGAGQTLPGREGGVWSFSPRLGISYPISLRDVFSMSYARIQQAPGRDYLYDTRTAISDRQPLGNPALTPSNLISYEAGLKHLFGPTWALQASVFYRDVYGLVGARKASDPGAVNNLLYQDTDEEHALGFEWTLIHSAGERAHFEASYTWMQAYGSESRPEGDPYGAVRDARLPPLGSTPLSWDRRHAVLLAGAWEPRDRWSLAWATSVGSALPWTPKPRRQPFTNLVLVNSERLTWTESTHLGVQWRPRRLRGLAVGFEARNLFDHRGERVVTVDGFPSETVNTVYDDYGAYRTETGDSGGAFWSESGGVGHWVPVHDPRLMLPPRALRASLGMNW